MAASSPRAPAGADARRGAFQALLLYDQIDFLRQPPRRRGDRDFALNVQRICLEAANGFQRFLRNRAAWATSRETLDAMFRVTGLALNAIHSFVKWGYFLNEPAAPSPWKQMHALYRCRKRTGIRKCPSCCTRAAQLQALGAIALPAHADPRPAQYRQPLQGADRDRRRLVLVVVQRLLARHRSTRRATTSSTST
jgi:hypothetical protein